MSGFANRMRAGSAALILGVAILAGAWTTSEARELTIGMRVAPTSTDPHWMTSPNNWHINAMIFEPMVQRDESAISKPGLAERWETPDDKTWIFHLRKDVKWHDGTPFTAEDVVFTYGRAGKVPKAPTSFQTWLNQIDKMEIIDPHTLKITTHEPCPIMLERLAYVPLVSRKHGENATTEDYNSGKVMIGTGPYKFGSWIQNENTVLVRNDNYWGEKEPWEKVTYRMMLNDTARMAALLSGQIDVMDTVPSLEVDRLAKDPKLKVWTRPTGRINYYTMDLGAVMESGRVTGPNGEKLDKNPFEDAKVRQAMALAVDRDAMARRFYGGTAEPTTQYLPKEGIGHVPELNVSTKGDMPRAQKLLEESGWKGKFKLEIATAPQLLESADGVTQALAQTWTRIGIPTTVVSIPYAVLIQTRNERKIPLTVGAYMNTGGGPDNFFSGFLHSRDPKKGMGALNYSFYDNKEVDALIEKGVATMNEADRRKIFSDVMRRTIGEARMVPLWFSKSVHASKSDLVMKPRVDFQVLATNIRPAGAIPTAAKNKK